MNSLRGGQNLREKTFPYMKNSHAIPQNKALFCRLQSLGMRQGETTIQELVQAWFMEPLKTIHPLCFIHPHVSTAGKKQR